MEETALRLWDKGQVLYDAQRKVEQEWTVPKCERHDQGIESELGLTDSNTEASVLLIEDMGETCDIASYLQRSAKGESISPELETQIYSHGEILGTSLAKLHSQEALKAVCGHPETKNAFSQNLTDHLVWGAMLDDLPPYLESFTDAEELYKRVEDDFKRPQYHYPLVLSHGDFHTGNIMISPSHPTPIVLDWEFGHLGRGFNDDVPKFAASLHCMLIDARRRNPRLAKLLRALLAGFRSGYRAKARRTCDVRDPRDETLRLLRSAMLFHGTEMIAFGSYFMGESAALREMIGVGMWYLRRAGADVEDFIRQGVEMLKEDEDEAMLSSFFLAQG